MKKVLITLILSVAFMSTHVQAQTENTVKTKKFLKKKTLKKKVRKKKINKQKVSKKKSKKKAVKAQHQRGLSIKADLAFGYDSNPFATPSKTYVDYSTTAQPTITPKVLSGFYIPYEFTVYQGKKISKKLFYGLGLSLKGRFFTDALMSNANAYHNKLKVDMTYYVQKYKSKKSGFKLETFYSDHFETYVDHDNGENKNTRYDGSGSDIENRYQYISGGLSLSHFYVKRKWSLWTKVYFERLDYAKPIKWSELDHNYYYASSKYTKKFNKKNKLSLEYRYSVRDYDVRPAFEYNSTRITLTSNTVLVPLVYTFHELRTQHNYKISKKHHLITNYTYQRRIDEYMGYNSSDYHKLKLTSKYTYSKKVSQTIFTQVAQRAYDRAIAYDKIPTLDSKYYFKSDVGFDLKYKMDKTFSLFANIKYENQLSADKRYEYDRITSLVGLHARY